MSPGCLRDDFGRLQFSLLSSLEVLLELADRSDVALEGVYLVEDCKAQKPAELGP